MRRLPVLALLAGLLLVSPGSAATAAATASRAPTLPTIGSVPTTPTSRAPTPPATVPSAIPNPPVTAVTPPPAGTPPVATTPGAAPAPPAGTPTTATTATTPAADDGSHDTLAIALVTVVGSLLLLAVLLWALARWLVWEPEWLLRQRHATAEAGWRMSAAWAEFRDWLRLGR